jgi:hypothetical protein
MRERPRGSRAPNLSCGSRRFHTPRHENAELASDRRSWRESAPPAAGRVILIGPVLAVSEGAVRQISRLCGRGRPLSGLPGPARCTRMWPGGLAHNRCSLSSDRASGQMSSGPWRHSRAPRRPDGTPATPSRPRAVCPVGGPCRSHSSATLDRRPATTWRPGPAEPSTSTWPWPSYTTPGESRPTCPATAAGTARCGHAVSCSPKPRSRTGISGWHQTRSHMVSDFMDWRFGVMSQTRLQVSVPALPRSDRRGSETAGCDAWGNGQLLVSKGASMPGICNCSLPPLFAIV